MPYRYEVTKNEALVSTSAVEEMTGVGKSLGLPSVDRIGEVAWQSSQKVQAEEFGEWCE